MNDREAFEAWLTPRRGKICPPHPEDYWEVWQAALASERAKQSATTNVGIDWANPATLNGSASPAMQADLAACKHRWAHKLDGKTRLCVLCGQYENVLSAAHPAVQAEPVACSYCGMRSGHLAACKRPPADDEAVRKDAERYRWLREQKWDTKCAACWAASAEETDAAIDAYLAKVKR